MICENKKEFRFLTKDTEYILRVTKYKHLEHIYYGPRLSLELPIQALQVKRSAVIGSSILYDQQDELYCLDQICLEWSGNGCGDFRQSPIEILMPDGTYSTDFLYQNHEIYAGCQKMSSLPSAYDEEDKTTTQTVKITCKDKKCNVYLDFYYTVFEESNVITRRCVLRNEEEAPLQIRKLCSMMMDIPARAYEVKTLEGAWAKEAHLHTYPLDGGMHVNTSTTGSSSNRRNPGFLVAEKTATQESGIVYGVNLIYSGNHMSFVEYGTHGLVRIATGISPHCFSWDLQKGENFEAPEAVLTFSQNGYLGVSKGFHDFVNNHVVRGFWKNKVRPILFNSWEAYFFDFTEKKLLSMAKECSKLGAELFVLDDGWFQGRDNDKAGLGDYTINSQKLPEGLSGFITKIEKMGLKFGLWVEPEMINEDSDLYRAHPEYAIKIPGRQAHLGRNQYVLDLCNTNVQEYIISNLNKLLEEHKITYIKWDMNRHITDAYSETLTNQGEFYHRYMMGLYAVLEQVFYTHPDILLETCSSGGNRFDLGMLCYGQQIWASDDTDPVERLKIQEGLSYFDALSTMGAHVSRAPHQQTIREHQLSTRFNVDAVGGLVDG